jgi:hypothetical protein
VERPASRGESRTPARRANHHPPPLVPHSDALSQLGSSTALPTAPPTRSSRLGIRVEAENLVEDLALARKQQGHARCERDSKLLQARAGRLGGDGKGVGVAQARRPLIRPSPA